MQSYNPSVFGGTYTETEPTNKMSDAEKESLARDVSGGLEEKIEMPKSSDLLGDSALTRVLDQDAANVEKWIGNPTETERDNVEMFRLMEEAKAIVASPDSYHPEEASAALKALNRRFMLTDEALTNFTARFGGDSARPAQLLGKYLDCIHQLQDVLSAPIGPRTDEAAEAEKKSMWESARNILGDNFASQEYIDTQKIMANMSREEQAEYAKGWLGRNGKIDFTDEDDSSFLFSAGYDATDAEARRWRASLDDETKAKVDGLWDPQIKEAVESNFRKTGALRTKLGREQREMPTRDKWDNPAWEEYASLLDKRSKWVEEQRYIDRMASAQQRDASFALAMQVIPFLNGAQKQMVAASADGNDMEQYRGVFKLMDTKTRRTMMTLMGAVRPETDPTFLTGLEMGGNRFFNAADEFSTALFYQVFKDATAQDELKEEQKFNREFNTTLGWDKLKNPSGAWEKAWVGLGESMPLQGSAIGGAMALRTAERLAKHPLAKLGLKATGVVLNGLGILSMAGDEFENLENNGVARQDALMLSLAAGIGQWMIENSNTDEILGTGLSASELMRIGWMSSIKAASRSFNKKEVEKFGKGYLQREFFNVLRTDAKAAFKIMISEAAEEFGQGLLSKGVEDYATGRKSLIGAFLSEDAIEAGAKAFKEALPTCTLFGVGGALFPAGSRFGFASDKSRMAAFARMEEQFDTLLDEKVRMLALDAKGEEYVAAEKQRQEKILRGRTAQVVRMAESMSDGDMMGWLNAQEDMTPAERAFFAEAISFHQAASVQVGQTAARAYSEGNLQLFRYELGGAKFDVDTKTGKVTGVHFKDGEEDVHVNILDMSGEKFDIGKLPPHITQDFIAQWNKGVEEGVYQGTKFSSDVDNMSVEERQTLLNTMEDMMNGFYMENSNTILLTSNASAGTLAHETSHATILDALQNALDRQTSLSRSAIGRIKENIKKRMAAVGGARGMGWDEATAIEVETIANLAADTDPYYELFDAMDFGAAVKNFASWTKELFSGKPKSEKLPVFRTKDANVIAPSKIIDALINDALTQSMADERSRQRKNEEDKQRGKDRRNTQFSITPAEYKDYYEKQRLAVPPEVSRAAAELYPNDPDGQYNYINDWLKNHADELTEGMLTPEEYARGYEENRKAYVPPEVWRAAAELFPGDPDGQYNYVEEWKARNGEKDAPAGVQKQANTNYPDAADEIRSLPDARFSIGKKAREEAKALILKKRPDLAMKRDTSRSLDEMLLGESDPYVERDEEETNRIVEGIVDEIGKFNTPKEQKAALHWFIRGTIRLPEDAPKVTEALQYAERAKGKANTDAMNYTSPMEMIEALHAFKPKAKPINPDTVPELSDKQEMGNGVTTYLVQDDRQGQQAMRQIINTHWGEDANPWCLLQGDGHGNLSDGSNGGYDAWHYWKHYSALPKRVAFKDGKLLAFMATDQEAEDWEYADLVEYWDERREHFNMTYDTEFEDPPTMREYYELNDEEMPVVAEQWWDRQDSAHYGIPLGNMPVPNDSFGRWANYEIRDGKAKQIGGFIKGTRGKDGYRQWNADGSLHAFTVGRMTAEFSSNNAGEATFVEVADSAEDVYDGHSYSWAMLRSEEGAAVKDEAERIYRELTQKTRFSIGLSKKYPSTYENPDNLFRLKTDMPKYDDIITHINDKDWLEEQGIKASIVGMTPDEYFKEAVKTLGAYGQKATLEDVQFKIKRSQDTINELRKVGKNIDMPMLDFTTRSLSQEGIRRMALAKQVKDTTYPVLVVEDEGKNDTRFSMGGLNSNENIVQYTPKGGNYDRRANSRRANSRGYGEGLASESVQRAIAEIIDGRREASSVRRTGLEIGWEPGREITEIAKRNGCFIPLDDFKNLIANDYRRPDFAGGEHQTWKTRDGNSVIKLNGFFNTLERNEEPIDVFDRYAIHNQLFINCQYELLGFTEIDKTPYFVVRQYFVANAREATQSEIDEYFKNKGFTPNGGGYWTNADGISASDVVGNNVLVNDKGDVFVIDAVLRDTKADALFSLRSAMPEGYVDTDAEGRTRFSIATYNNGGRKTLVDWLDNAVRIGEITRKDADDIVSETDCICEVATRLANSGKFAHFSNWSKATVELDEDGNPYFGIVRKNGDYAYNLDFSTVCKKRVPLDHIFNSLVADGTITDENIGLLLSQENIPRIQDIIKKHGLEVACALCFVDSKRYRVGGAVKDFSNLWNSLVRLQKKGGKKWKETLKRATEKKTKTDFEKIVLLLDSDPSTRHLVDASQLVSGEGVDRLAKEFPSIHAFFKGKGGSSKAKDPHGNVPYNNDIINPFEHSTNSKNGFRTISTEAAYSVGGVRLQSFSDFIPALFFDYAQMFAELAAKQLPLHTYTKEADFVKIFGLTGAKINMSLVPAGTGVKWLKAAEGKKLGLIPVWGKNRKNVTKGGLTAFYDMSDETFPIGEAFALRDKEGNVGTCMVGISDEHISLCLADPRIDYIIPYHKSGINPVVAKMRGIDKYEDYTLYQHTKGVSKEFFDFYASLAKTGDPRKTADEYINECEKGGLKPKFSDSKQHTDFTKDENYYKLLADFRLLDGNGKYSPQTAVKTQYPTNLTQVLHEALTHDQMDADALERETEPIKEEIRAEVFKMTGGRTPFSIGDVSANRTAAMLGALGILRGENMTAQKFRTIRKSTRSSLTIPELMKEADKIANENRQMLNVLASDKKRDRLIARAGMAARHQAAIDRSRAADLQFAAKVQEETDALNRANERTVRDIKGFTADKILNELGIDPASLLLALRPAEKPPKPRTEQVEEEIDVEEADEQSSLNKEEMEYAHQRAEALLQNARDALEKAKEAQKNKPIKIDKDGKQETKPSSSTKEDSSSGEGEEDDIRGTMMQEAILTEIRKAGLSIDNPAEMVKLAEVITEDYIRRNIKMYPGITKGKKLMNDPRALALLSGNIARFAQMAAEAYCPTWTRERVAKKAQMLNDKAVKTLKGIERIGVRIFEDLNRDIIRESRKSLIKQIHKKIDNLAKKHTENALNETRKVSSEVSAYLKKVKKAIDMSADEVEEKINEYEKLCNDRYQGINEEAADNYRDYHEAQDWIYILSYWGNLKSKMPSEIKSELEYLDQLVNEDIYAMMQHREEYDRHVKEAVDAIAKGIAPDPKNKGKKPTKDPLVYSVVGMFEAKYRQYLRFNKNTEESSKAKEAFSALEQMIQDSCVRETNFINEYKERLLQILLSSYGSLDAANKALTEKFDAPWYWVQLNGDNNPQVADDKGVTAGRALQMYVSIIQDDYIENVEKWGRDGEYRTNLEKLLGLADANGNPIADSPHAKFIEGLRGLYLEMGSRLDKVLYETTGTHLRTPNRNYMPVKMDRRVKRGKTGEGRAFSPFAPSLTPRIKNGRDFDQTADIVDIFLGRINDSAHTIGWSQTGPLIMRIAQSDNVINTIERDFGDAEARRWNNYIFDIVAGPQISSLREGKGMEVVMRYASLLWLGGNPASWAKQLSSIPCLALSNRVTLRELGAGLSMWATHPTEMLKAAHALASSDAFKARYGSALSNELRYAISDDNAFATWKNRLVRAIMSGVSFMDKVGVLIASGVYFRRRQQLELQGKTLAEAHELASNWMMAIVDSTMQSGRTVNMTEAQRKGGINAFIQFKSSPMQQLQYEITAYQEWAADIKNREKLKNFVKAVVVNHVLVPFGMTIVDTLMAFLTSWGIPDEEKKDRLLARLMKEVIAGPFGSLFFIGGFLEHGTDVIVQLALGIKSAYGGVFGHLVPAESALDFVAKNVEDIVDAMKDISNGEYAEAMVAIGLATANLTPGLSWTARTGKKIYDSVNEDPREKAKKARAKARREARKRRRSK